MLIAAERASSAIDQVVGDEDDVAIAAVTAAELLAGVELADRRRRTARRHLVDALLTGLPVEPYDLEVARSDALPLARTRKSGRARGVHDLLIAATALAHGRSVVTADAAGFEDLPGVAVNVLPRAH